MGRKKPQPHHMDEAQRTEVEWNMMDLGPGQSTEQLHTPGDLIIVHDNDPLLALERESADREQKSKKSGRAGVVLNGTSYCGSEPRPGSSTQFSTASGTKTALCGVSLPENVRQFFRRPEMCMQLFELKDRFLCLPLYSVKHNHSRDMMDNWHWIVGKFKVQLKDYCDLTMTSATAQCLSELERCWLGISLEAEDEPVVYFEVDDEEMNLEKQATTEEESNGKKTTIRRSSSSSPKGRQASEDCLGLYWTVDLEFSDTWTFFQKLSRSGQKKFQLVYGELNNENWFEVTVLGRKDSLQRLDYPSQGFVIREANNFLYEAMGLFYNLGPMYGKGDPSLHQDFQELYEGVRALQMSQTFSINIEVQHPSLKPLLRPYQQDAVRWMLHRERFDADLKDVENDDELHPLYTEVTTHCGKTLFYNREGGSLVLEKPRKVISPPGGILAEEMGLGKTVEVLCCMLLHPRPDIPLPPRLPTLMEMEAKSHFEEKNLEAAQMSTSSSSSDLPSVGTSNVKISEAENHSLKRVDSDSCSLSSIPSEVVSFVVTDDHSYQARSASDSEDSKVMDSKNLTALLATAPLNPDAATKAEGVFQPPQRPMLKKVPSDNGRILNEQSDINCDSKSQTSSVDDNSELKELETSGKRKRKSSNRKPKVQLTKKRKNSSKKSSSQVQDCKNSSAQPKPQKRKLAEDTENQNSLESENVGSKTKRMKYFYYTSEEDVRGKFFDIEIKRAKQQFECVCGKGEFWNRSASSRKKKHPVKCTECGTSQHAECVNYNLQDPFRGPYKCPHCHYSGPPRPSGATLIISPHSIAHQWLDEIQKHIQEKSIKVFEYTGVRYQGYIQPQTLASQDIVITTYETLRNELNYVDLKPTNSEQGRVLRNPKKFMAQPTPLTAVEWWRICLDEAQMVECVTTKTAEMALRLSCVNRWCVTGTPLNQSIKDLYGLLAFIGYDPYCVEEWWTRYLYEPYLQGIKQPMFETLAKVMWRTTMKDVKSQLNLPDKSEVIKHLTFSPVEDVFYKRLHQKCSYDIMGPSFGLTEAKKSSVLRKLDHQTVNKYLIPLRKLRQACCHPQAVSGSSLSMKDSVMTMEELLDNMIKKTTLECEESHRCMIASMNGQAGIYLIEDQPRVVEAVEKYRAVLMSVEELERDKKLRTDALPVIHAMHNLAEVLATNPPGVGRTLRDDQLTVQCEELKRQYLQRASNLVVTCKEQLTTLHKSAEDIEKQLGGGLFWYQRVLYHAVQAGNEGLLVQKVKSSLADLLTQLTKTFSSVSGLQYIILDDLDELQNLRKRQMEFMEELEHYSLKQEVIMCCLRPVPGMTAFRCFFCKLEKEFLKWESRLFCMTISQRTQAGVDNSLYRDGTWKDSPVETMLRAIYSYARSHQLEGQLLKDAALVFNMFEVWKKEFKQMRALWTKLKEEVSAQDEVEMAITRMRLRLPGEQKDEHVMNMNICEAIELPAMLRKLSSDQTMYASELRVRCGQLDYLRNLAKGNSAEFQDGINPEECPICKTALGRNWTVMRCGHCCCFTCIQHLIEHCPASRNHDIGVKCMICREKTKASEISYISTSRSSANSSVKGSHSTKVKAIVQCLIDIQKEDPEAKTLVFATWVEVLKVIGRALDDNFIKHTQLFDHGSHFEKNVSKFRTDKTVQVLLLPYSTGSKGLNLFEANHVLLVEPTYSPSEEAQAIGRVYRMGQTRPTKIYRFLVRQTIEERIHALMESTLRPAANANATDKDAITLGQLISLFEDCEEEEEDSEDPDGEASRGDANRNVEPIAGPSHSTQDLDNLSGPEHETSQGDDGRGLEPVTGPSHSAHVFDHLSGSTRKTLLEDNSRRVEPEAGPSHSTGDFGSLPGACNETLQEDASRSVKPLAGPSHSTRDLDNLSDPDNETLLEDAGKRVESLAGPSHTTQTLENLPGPDSETSHEDAGRSLEPVAGCSYSAQDLDNLLGPDSEISKEGGGRSVEPTAEASHSTQDLNNLSGPDNETSLKDAGESSEPVTGPSHSTQDLNNLSGPDNETSLKDAGESLEPVTGPSHSTQDLDNLLGPDNETLVENASTSVEPLAGPSHSTQDLATLSGHGDETSLEHTSRCVEPLAGPSHSTQYLDNLLSPDIETTLEDAEKSVEPLAGPSHSTQDPDNLSGPDSETPDTKKSERTLAGPSHPTQALKNLCGSVTGPSGACGASGSCSTSDVTGLSSTDENSYP